MQVVQDETASMEDMALLQLAEQEGAPSADLQCSCLFRPVDVPVAAPAPSTSKPKKPTASSTTTKKPASSHKVTPVKFREHLPG